jgi:hypothetical protein
MAHASFRKLRNAMDAYFDTTKHARRAIDEKTKNA